MADLSDCVSSSLQCMADQSQTDSLGPSENAGMQQPVSCVGKEQIRMVAGAFSNPKSEQKQEGEDEEEDEEVDDEDDDLWEEQEDEEEEEGIEELLGRGGEMRSRRLEPVDILAKCIQVEEVQM